MTENEGAALRDELDVRFGGSLVGNLAYTAAGAESMRGSLRRMVGTEQQIPGLGVALSGGDEGCRFETSPGSGFVLEVVFVPSAEPQDDLSTVFPRAARSRCDTRAVR